MVSVIYYFVRYGLSKLNAEQAFAFLTIVIKNIEAYATTFTNPTPDLVNFKAQLVLLQQYIADASTGLHTAITLRNEQLKVVIELGRQLASYVQTTSAGNKRIIELSGFGVRNLPTPAQLLAPPTAVQLLGSLVPNALNLRFPRVKGARSYNIELCTGDPGVEANWSTYTISSNSRNTITGLVPGTLYYVRVAAINSKGQSAWSELANKRCV